ncbi:MAG: gamma-glutamyltransferase [Rhodobiaceae bacterium]|nr:gamma-glutamyltransferase [Rhodobiaceae bacterium]MCC0041207.1 gamma-glutamyltransferase [Rhodobiaceae bacterium]
MKPDRSTGMFQSLLTGLVALAIAFAALPVRADVMPIITGNERFHPVHARNGMVASQEAAASQIGLSILERSGNAVDAAVATAFALAVTLPRAGNLGGGGFMLVHLAESGETVAIDYRETAPAAATRDMFLAPDGKADPKLSRDSGLGVGVPGTVAGLALAHARYGSGKFSLADLIAPAAALAGTGITVSDDLAMSLASAAERLTRFNSTRTIFYTADGEPPQPGSRLVQKDLGLTLRAIATGGPEAFYTGEIAERIAASVRDAGGVMTVDDLAGYKPKLREPVRGTYRGHEIVSMPPPSSGGIHILQILKMLEGFDLAGAGAGSALHYHLLAEAMRRAYADRATYLGDPDHVAVPVEALLDDEYLKARATGIDPRTATPSSDISAGTLPRDESEQTTHFSVVDRFGNAVANTYTLNFSYGLGQVAQGTGVLLNNELDDFAAAPGVPNAYGLIGGEANAPAPAKRPLSSMSPTFVFTGGKLRLVTGTPGGSRIISMVAQVVSDMVDFGMNPAEAVAFPRMHHQWYPDILWLEKGVSPDTARLLERMGHTVKTSRAAGSVQSIMIIDEGLLAGASDPRRPGAGVAAY